MRQVTGGEHSIGIPPLGCLQASELATEYWDLHAVIFHWYHVQEGLFESPGYFTSTMAEMGAY